MRKLIDVYKGSNSPDYISMVQCLIIVDDPNAVALVLETLSQGSQDDILMAYQVEIHWAFRLLLLPQSILPRSLNVILFF